MPGAGNLSLLIDLVPIITIGNLIIIIGLIISR